MSLLSRNIGGSIGGGLGSLLGGAIGIPGTIIGGGVGYNLGNKVSQPGKTGSHSDVNAFSINPQGQQIADEIIKKIQANNVGTYGEGQIVAAVQSFDELENKVKKGEISQSDYIQIAQNILPKVYEFGQGLARSGSAPATAVNNAGLAKIGKQLSNFKIYKSGQELLGRDLTPEEFAQAAPIFQQENGETLGNAWMANLKKIDDQNPNSISNKKKSEEFGSNVDQYFKSALGRAATADEKAHFGGLLATGNLDAYGLNQFLQGTPEYQNQQDTKFRSGLSSELEKTDLSFFNKAKQNVMSQFLQNGTGTSSALDSALTDLMGQIADKRSSYMTDLSAKQYGGNKDLALSNYKNAMNQYLGEQGFNRGNSLKNQDYLQGRSDDLTDYRTQMNDYMSYLSQQENGHRNGVGGAIGSLLGAGIGAGLGGPSGAQTGALVGNSAGNAFDYLR